LLKDKIEKKIQSGKCKKKIKKIELNHQTRGPGNETWTTS
jgi:hypothetical protein